jgi:tetratricopeptide (TPR) repeat protein
MNDEEEAALDEFSIAAQEDPSDEAMVLEVARRFVQAKKPEKAAEILKRAAARPGASGAVYARLGLVLAQLGRTEEAIEANRMAVKSAPTLLTGYQSLFLSYIQSKQPQLAWQILEQASKQPNGDAEFLIGLAELYANYALQQPDEKKVANAKALDLLHRAEKLNPPNPALRLQLAEDLNAQGDSEKAAQIYLELLKKLPDIPMIRERVHARLTDIYLRSQDHKRAMEQLESIVRDDPTNPQAYYFLGSIALADKKLAEATDYFRKTILLNPQFQQAYFDLAMAQLESQHAPAALETLQQAKQKFAPSFILEFMMGMASSATKDFSAAVQHFTAAEVLGRATDPKRLNEYFYFQFGAACERSGNAEDAEKNFRKCLEVAPNFAEALNYLGYMWAEKGIRLNEARTMIEKAVQIEPKNAAYLDSMAWVSYKQKDFPGALGWARKAVDASDQPDPTLLEHLGDIYKGLNEPAKAREAWQQSLALEPNEDIRKKVQALGAK